jgi:hypothetical protein
MRTLQWVAMFVSVVALVFLAVPAFAHGSAEWIMRSEHSHCCGERDCAAMPDGSVKITQGGYFIPARNETIPYNKALPSVDGQYWLCVELYADDKYWPDGPTRCFFAPVTGM